MLDLVSVYIPTKNRVGLLKRAVNSVLSQTFRNIELIVVSDGSEDETCDYVRSLNSDIVIKLIHNERSVGASAARNQAIQNASGKYITGLDDDDMFLPHRIECFLTQWNILTSEGRQFSCLYDRRVVNVGDQVWLWDVEPMVDLKMILNANEVGNQVFTTHERMIEAGAFDEKMPAWQDWETWVRLIKKFGPAHSINSNTYIMDISHEFERITSKSSEKILLAANLFYRKHCTPRNLSGILRSLGGYSQISLSLRDLFIIFRSGDAKYVLNKIRRRNFKFSFTKILTK